MIVRAFIVVVFGFLGLASAANAQYAANQCGGSYTAQDGASYKCKNTRKPYCQQGTGRCQCLERRECGGKQDEEW